MENKILKLNVVTPERLLVDNEDAKEVVAVGSEGEFAVLPGHTPFLTDLKPGLLWYKNGEEVNQFVISGGFAEVLPYKVNILADSAEKINEIDLERAEESRKRAEERLSAVKEKSQDSHDIDFLRAEASLKRAINRIKYASSLKG